MLAFERRIEKPTTFLKRATELYIGDVRILIAQSVLAFAACALYVIETYVEDDDEDGASEPWILATEFVLAVVFLVDYVASVAVASDRMAYIVSLPSLADILSILPVASLLWEDDSIDVLRVLRVFKAVRILRLHRLLELNRRRGSSTVLQRALMLSISITGLIFVASAIVHAIESQASTAFGPSGNVLQFHDAFYFVVVTVTTVGYGDISPVSTTSRLMTCAVILLSFFLLPLQARNLITAITSRSPFAGAYSPPSRSHHVVVTGVWGSAQTLEVFLNELLHTDHGERGVGKLSVVILSPSGPPDDQVRLLLKQPRYSATVKYLIGSVTSAKDCQRAAVGSAEAVFVLAPHQCAGTPAAFDASVILSCIALRKFVGVDSRVLIVAQVLLPSSAAQLRATGIRHVICRDELVPALLAQSCLSPGLSTLLSNLVRSLSPLPNDVADGGPANKWLLEYYNGASQELYTSPLGVELAGRTFNELVGNLYTTRGVVLLGLIRGDQVVINPVPEFEVQLGDAALVVAYSSAAAQAHVMPATTNMVLHSTSNPLHIGKTTAIPVSDLGSLPLVNLPPPTPEAEEKADPDDSVEEKVGCGDEEEEEGKAEFKSGDPLDLSVGESKAPDTPPPPPAPTSPRPSLSPSRLAGTPSSLARAEGSISAASSLLARSRASIDAAIASLSLRPSSGTSVSESLTAVRDGLAALDDAKRLLQDPSRNGPVRFDDELPEDVKDHILVVGSAPAAAQFLTLLWAALCARCETVTVCVLTPSLDLSPLDDAVEARRIRLPLHAVFGEATSRSALRRCRLSAVRSCIVLGDPDSTLMPAVPVANQQTIVSASARETQADADVVLGALEVSNAGVDDSLLVYLNFVDNTKFLKPSTASWAPTGAASSFLWPSFSAGRVFSASMLVDYLLPQLYHDPQELLAIHALLHLREDGGVVDEGAAGVKNTKPLSTRTPRPHFRLVTPPEELHGLEFSSTFLAFLSQGKVCVGIYRGAGTHGSTLPYVVTNPSADMVLLPTDQAFVLQGHGVL